nr:copia protein [Tanacetum cinerariifolium]
MRAFEPKEVPEKEGTSTEEKQFLSEKHPEKAEPSPPPEREIALDKEDKGEDAFAWVPANMTGIPRFVAEHELKTYSHIEPRVQRKRSITPDRRKVVKEEVEEWLKSIIVKKVWYPTWVANSILVKKGDGSWRMCIDFKDLNIACPKDLCGDPNHLIGECPKPPKDKNQRAFVEGSWSDSGEEDNENVKNETCLVAQESSEMCLGVDLEPDEWIKDSGCSKHMPGNQKLFSSYKAYNEGNVIFGNNLRGNIIGKGLWYPKGTCIETIVYADSDHAGDYVDRKSTSGIYTFVGCCLTSWFLKKQTVLAISTTEAEYVSARKACQQALWMKQALIDYDVRLNDVPIMYDNKGAIDLSKNPMQHSHTKHIEIRHHFLRDNVQKGHISIEKVPSGYNIADILTKLLKRKLFNYLRLGLGMMEHIL